MKNTYYELEQDWNENVYDAEISFNMEEEQLYDEVFFASSTNNNDEDDEEQADTDWGQVDPQEDGVPSDNDPSGPGSAV